MSILHLLVTENTLFDFFRKHKIMATECFECFTFTEKDNCQNQKAINSWNY